MQADWTRTNPSASAQTNASESLVLISERINISDLSFLPERISGEFDY